LKITNNFTMKKEKRGNGKPEVLDIPVRMSRPSGS